MSAFILFSTHKIYSEYPRNFRRIIYFRIRTCSSSLNVPGPQTRAHLASNLILNRDGRRAAGATVIPDGIANTAAASRKYRDKHRARSENGRKGNAETCHRGPLWPLRDHLRRVTRTTTIRRKSARGFLYVPRSGSNALRIDAGAV